MGHQPIGFAAQKTISGKYIERDWYQLGYGVWILGAAQKRSRALRLKKKMDILLFLTRQRTTAKKAEI